MNTPQNSNVSLKEFLRIVVGDCIASARTETSRTHFLRQYFSAYQGTTDYANQTIAHRRKVGFDTVVDFEWHDKCFREWAKGLLSRRASKAAKAKHQLRKATKKEFGADPAKPELKQAEDSPDFIASSRRKNSSSKSLKVKKAHQADRARKK